MWWNPPYSLEQPAPVPGAGPPRWTALGAARRRRGGPTIERGTLMSRASFAKPRMPMTGEEFLASLRDEREVWVYGERVRDVTAHPAFRNVARMLARLYDALH